MSKYVCNSKIPKKRSRQSKNTQHNNLLKTRRKKTIAKKAIHRNLNVHLNRPHNNQDCLKLLESSSCPMGAPTYLITNSYKQIFLYKICASCIIRTYLYQISFLSLSCPHLSVMQSVNFSIMAFSGVLKKVRQVEYELKNLSFLETDK